MNDVIHLPRLYSPKPIALHSEVALDEGQCHYVRHVLRLNEGGLIRIFNPECGEWLAELIFTGKKSASARAKDLLRLKQPQIAPLALYFSPIKKERQDWMIEKAVELGVTHFFPLLMQRSVVRDINLDRTRLHIIEAAEQCERLDIPEICAPQNLSVFLRSAPPYAPLYAALERMSLPLLRDVVSHRFPSAPASGRSLLIGPEGGFSDEEMEKISAQVDFIPVSFGERILRAETAALYGLSILSE